MLLIRWPQFSKFKLVENRKVCCEFMRQIFEVIFENPH